MNRIVSYLPQGRSSLLVCALLLAFAFAMMPAHAQRGGRRAPLLAEEEAKVAWAVEAGYVAKKLELPKEAATKLAKAYETTRTSYAAAIEKKREELTTSTEDRSARRAAYRKMQQEVGAAERDKFNTAVAAFLSEEQTKEAVTLLWAFSSQSDLMIHALKGCDLGDKEDRAIELVVVYAQEGAKARERATGEEGSFEELHDILASLRVALDKALAGVLSEEQFAKWKEGSDTHRRRPARSGDEQRQSGTEETQSGTEETQSTNEQRR